MTQVAFRIVGAGRERFVVATLPAVIGRSEDCDIHLPDTSISRKHVRLDWDEHAAGPRLVDLGSANGTSINGTPQREAMLQPGDRIALGDFELILDAPAAARPAETFAIERKLAAPAPNDLDVHAICDDVRRRIADEAETLRQGGERILRAWVDASMAERDVGFADIDRLRIRVLADLLGYGPLEPLLADEAIDEILVNGPKQIYIEEGGKLRLTGIQLRDDAVLRHLIERIVAPLGRRIDEASPSVDARLPDGSRVHAVIPPISLIGPVLTIRKFRRQRLTVDSMVASGACDCSMVDLLRAAVQGRCNIVVSGGTGTGKTTVLNVLSSFISTDERVVTIEDAAELQLAQPHVVRLEARPANAEGAGAVPIKELLRNALRMRPDRIVVGECRGGEALDMLQAMNTGHDGSLTTVHANSPRDAIARIETMCLMADLGLPHRAIREQIVRAVDIVVQLSRFADGARRIVEIAEVQGVEGDVPVLQTLCRFDAASKTFESTGFPLRALSKQEH